MSGHDAVILGAGAAGCMAAIQAGKRGRKVLLIDGGKRVGGKIPISGGGRCNFTNRGASPEHYASQNPRFAHSALAGFSAQDTEDWVAGAGIQYYEKTLGQLFCRRSADDIVLLLERELAEAGVDIQLNARVEGLEQDGAGFRAFGPGWEARAAQAVVALGGLSYPALGASDLALRLAAQFGLKQVPTAPALDGFVWDAQDAQRFDDLPGLALDVRLEVDGHSFDEAVLFTHKGLSGPAALQGSLYWRPGLEVHVTLWPGEDAEAALLEAKREMPRQDVFNWVAKRLPRRLAERWDDLWGSGDTPLVRISDARLRAIAQAMQHWRFVPGGTVGYHKAEVTRGGVDTADLEQRTLQCRHVPGLYFVGEALDVTGELGGYNFQWAWASGAAAGRAL